MIHLPVREAKERYDAMMMIEGTPGTFWFFSAMWLGPFLVNQLLMRQRKVEPKGLDSKVTWPFLIYVAALFWRESQREAIMHFVNDKKTWTTINYDTDDRWRSSSTVHTSETLPQARRVSGIPLGRRHCLIS
jgi:hypothetical protein